MCNPAVISIANKSIGEQHPPFVIAELSANHNGSLDKALRIVEEAKKAGADAVKLQTYTADTITLDSNAEEFQIQDGLWGGKTLYNLYKEAHLPWEWHKPLFDYARKIDILMFSTPFDVSAVDFLEELNVPAYKIASFEAVDLPLIRYVASTGKPMIISTGMADVNEIEEAVQAAYDGGCKKLALLHCVSGYPAPAEEYNLRTIPDMIRRFGLVTGLSDHTLDNVTAITSVAMGARIIEKHITLNRGDGGPDDSFSLEPSEFSALCRGVKMAWHALGDVDYGQKSSEQGNVKFRRSLYFVKDLRAGDIITSDCVRSVRPGYGLPPKELPSILGRKLKVAVSAKSPTSREVIEPD